MATRSEPSAASSVTSTERSAPIASARRSDSVAFAGPSVTRTTSPSPASLMRKASSTACTSKALRAPSTERSRRFVCGSIRFGAPASGTCFTHTAIFIAWTITIAELANFGTKFARSSPDPLLGFGPSSANRSLMRRHRTTARGGISLLLLLGLSAGVAAASPNGYPGQDGPGPGRISPPRLHLRVSRWPNLRPRRGWSSRSSARRGPQRFRRAAPDRPRGRERHPHPATHPRRRPRGRNDQVLGPIPGRGACSTCTGRAARRTCTCT